jgi:hypothetical protein
MTTLTVQGLAKFFPSYAYRRPVGMTENGLATIEVVDVFGVVSSARVPSDGWRKYREVVLYLRNNEYTPAKKEKNIGSVVVDVTVALPIQQYIHSAINQYIEYRTSHEHD